MASRHRSLPQGPADDTTKQMTATLSSNKIAELVRQLAESRCEAQELRQRMQMSRDEGASSLLQATDQRDSYKEDTSLLQVQHERKQQDVDGLVGMNRNSAIVGSSCTQKAKDAQLPLSESQKLQTSLHPDPERMLLSSSSKNLSREVAAAPLAEVLSEEDKRCFSFFSFFRDEIYWKKKYTKLKRLHQKKIEDHEMQLAEVQNLLYKIHEEHDELRQCHEKNHLQQQLEIESKNRLLLEAKAKLLEEELLELQKRVGSFVGKPLPARNCVFAPEMTLSLADAIHIDQRQSCNDGLNQTDCFFLRMDAPAVNMIDTETLLPTDSDCARTTGQKRATVDQGSMRQWGQHIREPVFATAGGLRESKNAPSQQLCAVVSKRSVALQVEVPTAAAASQTETCGQRSVGSQVGPICSDDDGWFRESSLCLMRGSETVRSVGKNSFLASSRAETPRLQPRRGTSCGEAQGISRDQTRFQPSHISQSKSSMGHIYYFVGGEEEAENKKNVTPPVSFVGNEVAKRLLPDLFLPPVTSSSFFSAGAVETGVDTVSCGDEVRRRRLDEDIRKHDHLLAAVAKLQRRAQRAARTPSH